MAIEDQALHGSVGVALGRRDARDDGLQDLGHAGPVLGRGEDHFLARDGQHVLQFVHDRLGVRGREVDLVEDRDEGEVLAHGQMDVGQGLSLDALGRVDDEDRPLAGLEAVTDLVGEVDVPGGVDQVEAVGQAVVRLVLETDGAGLDRDALLALQVHRVQDLAGHLARVDGVGQLQQSIGERRLAVIDVGDDGEVAQALLWDGHEAGV